MRKSILALIILCATSTYAQVQSGLPDGAGPGMVRNPYGEATTVLVAGHFSSPGQTLDDLLAMDANGNFICLQSSTLEAGTPVPIPQSTVRSIGNGTNGSVWKSPECPTILLSVSSGIHQKIAKPLRNLLWNSTTTAAIL